MDLNKDAIIVFKDVLDEGYTPSTQNTIKVEDLINKLELSPELRRLTKNIDTIVNADAGILSGGHIKVKVSVEYSSEDLIE